MAALTAGTYRGTSDGLAFEFRVECDDSGVCILSGDVTRGEDFVASFVCDKPQANNGGAVTGAVKFRGNPDLFSGSVVLETDARGIGSFQLGVDLEGGHRDVF